MYAFDKYQDIISDESSIRKRQDQRTAYVAIEDGLIIGMICVQIYTNDKYIKITNLAIDLQHRRKGLATKLIGKVKEAAVMLGGKVVTFARESNLPAQMLLKKCDFRWVATLNHCYQDSTEPGYLFAFSPSDEGYVTIDHSLDKILKGY